MKKELAIDLAKITGIYDTAFKNMLIKIRRELTDEEKNRLKEIFEEKLSLLFEAMGCDFSDFEAQRLIAEFSSPLKSDLLKIVQMMVEMNRFDKVFDIIFPRKLVSGMVIM